jgi:hypothetical protein
MRIQLVWFHLLDDENAMAALPLLLAIHNQMNLKKATSISITEKVWGVAAGSSERKRKTMLRALKRVPDLVRLEERHRLKSRYRAHQGPLWNAEYVSPPDEDDEENPSGSRQPAARPCSSS